MLEVAIEKMASDYLPGCGVPVPMPLERISKHVRVFAGPL